MEVKNITIEQVAYLIGAFSIIFSVPSSLIVYFWKKYDRDRDREIAELKEDQKLMQTNQDLLTQFVAEQRATNKGLFRELGRLDKAVFQQNKKDP